MSYYVPIVLENTGPNPITFDSLDQSAKRGDFDIGLSGIEVAPMAECEGILVSREADGTVSVEELRVGRAPE